MLSLRVRLKMPCAKFGVDWSRNVGGIAKIQFCGFRDFAKKNYGRKWAWPMPKDAADSSESVCTRFSMWEVRCGSYSPKRVFFGIAPPRGRRVWILLSE